MASEREVLVSLLQLLNGIYGQEFWNKTALVFVMDSHSRGMQKESRAMQTEVKRGKRRTSKRTQKNRNTQDSANPKLILPRVCDIHVGC